MKRSKQGGFDRGSQNAVACRVHGGLYGGLREERGRRGGGAAEAGGGAQGGDSQVRAPPLTRPPFFQCPF
eukprot:990038-Rhodomonas_salina.2